MNEALLKSDLTLAARKGLGGFVVLRHEDKISYGHPDISITGNKLTTWIECKFANPGFQSKGIQELTMIRLADNGMAFYVVWYTGKLSPKRTYMVNPHDLGKPIETWTGFTEGYDHAWVLKRIWSLHHDHQRT